VTVSEVKRARLLKKEKGILAIPDPKKGRQISAEEIEIVEFYLSDEYSRLMPRMNDYISIRLQDGEKETKIQKRLLLLNIDELFFKFKEYSLNKLCMKCCSKSKFYGLRPKHVIEVGAAGTHNICVCKTHQNIKLLLDAIRGVVNSIRRCTDLKSKNDFFRFFQIFSDFFRFFRFFQIF
jgi:hypothetical protein